jgi:tRNA wybutosine-synthesizing protein 4
MFNYPKMSKSKAQNEAASIGTNSYSIVSKRSVEKLYFSNEPSFLKPFVAKFKRRAPLINRGYWLRMKAIENAVQEFLEQPSSKPRVVVNLGCGYDPLPFRMKFKGLGRNARFIDVDYADLIQKKTDIITSGDLRQYLDDDYVVSSAGQTKVILESSSYCAVGCDLADVKTLHSVLRNILQIGSHPILFVAEVTIAYMTIRSANELLKLASSFEDGR